MRRKSEIASKAARDVTINTNQHHMVYFGIPLSGVTCVTAAAISTSSQSSQLQRSTTTKCLSSVRLYYFPRVRRTEQHHANGHPGDVCAIGINEGEPNFYTRIQEDSVALKQGCF